MDEFLPELMVESVSLPCHAAAGDTGASTGQDGVMLTGDSFTSTMPSLSRGDYCAHEDTAKILGLVKMLKSHPDTAERAKCCDSLAELAAGGHQ